MSRSCEYCDKKFEYDPELDRYRCFSVSWGDFCGADCATEARRESHDKRLEGKDKGVLAPKVPEVPGADEPQERAVREVQNDPVPGVPKNGSRRGSRNKGMQGVQEGAAQEGVEAVAPEASQ